MPPQRLSETRKYAMKKYILALVLVPALTASDVPALGAEQEETTKAPTVAPVLAVPLLSFKPVRFEPRAARKTNKKPPPPVGPTADTPRPPRVFTIEQDAHGYRRVSVPFAE